MRRLHRASERARPPRLARVRLAHRLFAWVGTAISALVLFPADAGAQEPQPWTNTHGIGDRVVPALPAGPSAGSVRIGGGMGTTAEFDYRRRTADGVDDAGEATGAATFLSGRTGAGWGFGDGLDAFVTTNFYQVEFSKEFESEPGEGGAIVGGPYVNLGDAAIGGRYTRGLGESLRAGFEAGAIVYGATAGNGESGASFVGPALGATSPFGRALLTWQGLARRPGDEGRLTASLNLGFLADNSWKVWESAYEESRLTDETGVRRPLDTERLALGFYGEKGTAARILFGVSTAFTVVPRVRPYLEITGELTGGEATMRATPGLSLGVMERLDALLSADLDLSGADPKASPRAPATRANVGLRYAFGAERMRRPSRGGVPQPATRWVTLLITDDTGKPLPGATVRLLEGERVTAISATTDARGEARLREHDLRGGGRKLLVEKEPYSPRTVSLDNRDPRDALPPLRLYLPARVLVNFWDASKGQPWKEKTSVNVWALAAPGERPKRLASRETVTGEAKLEVAVPPTGALLAVQVVVEGIGTRDFKFENVRAGSLLELTAGSQGDRRIWIDGQRKCIALGEACGGEPPKTPTPPPTPTPVAGATPAATPSLERMSLMLFDPDLADVRPDGGKALLDRARGRDALVIVNAKMSGDAAFTQALLSARVSTLKQFLASNGAASVRVEVGDVDTENVVLELR